jgi:hypothetical protein
MIFRGFLVTCHFSHVSINDSWDSKNSCSATYIYNSNLTYKFYPDHVSSTLLTSRYTLRRQWKCHFKKKLRCHGYPQTPFFYQVSDITLVLTHGPTIFLANDDNALVSPSVNNRLKIFIYKPCHIFGRSRWHHSFGAKLRRRSVSPSVALSFINLAIRLLDD